MVGEHDSLQPAVKELVAKHEQLVVKKKEWAKAKRARARARADAQASGLIILRFRTGGKGNGSFVHSLSCTNTLA